MNQRSYMICLKIDKLSANYRFTERANCINRFVKYFAIFGIKNFLAYQYLIRSKLKKYFFYGI